MRLDETELIGWGERIGASLSPPTFIGLSGPLGAGKSVLARAIGRGAGVTEPMPSPTYTLVNRYAPPGGARVVHLDLYRLESTEQVWELGWEQLGRDDEIVLVEWPERATGLLPPDHLLVELAVPDGLPTMRDVMVRSVGSVPVPPAFAPSRSPLA